jgi:hypothetical protein
MIRGPSDPPAFVPTVYFKKLVRYTCTAGGSYPITRNQILSTLIVPISSGTGYRLCTAVRICSVHIYGQPNASSTVASRQITLGWTSEEGPSATIMDNSIGTTRGAVIHSKPPAKSLAGYWSLNGSDEATVLFTLGLNQNDQIDVEYECSLNDDTTVGSISISTGSAGQLAVSYLDFTINAGAAVILPNYVRTVR